MRDFEHQRQLYKTYSEDFMKFREHKIKLNERLEKGIMFYKATYAEVKKVSKVSCAAAVLQVLDVKHKMHEFVSFKIYCFVI